MKLLLRAYPRRWRVRYGDELLELLEARPPTWRDRVDVVAAGLAERLHESGPPELRVLWAWSLFVIGGMGFQKASEHWQVVVPGADRGVPTAAFDVVQVAAILGSAAVLIGVGLLLPPFLRDVRGGGWPRLRRPILTASAATVIATAALVAVAIGHDVAAASVFVAFAAVSLVAWTHAAAVAARRLQPTRAHTHLGLVVAATLLTMTAAAAVWLASVATHAPSFVGAAQLVVIAVFMLAGDLLALSGIRSLHA